ncbi:hypothetical protein BKN38_02170 [Helicobacter sp. CLO-3]|uniref:hypothetical protein n=1 Tax=unclassified Helicobacter TaxID=2593540 RepID=UPI0008047E81|nr:MULTISPECIES: hypothetical protein [unclassified Helicobacter]OBV29681.1 hypothetical protein BA723_04410 [Helicobacter sp. CLO-3]OHU84868.1 hypothetical protein BKN38_02170 [Helicobacter sp. CLO-3]
MKSITHNLNSASTKLFSAKSSLASIFLGAAVALSASLTHLNAAPDANNTYRNLKSSQSTLTKQFASGSIVSGSTYGSRSTNAARRWYIFNEGSVGGSYTMLGQANYWAVDLGYHIYLRSIEYTVLGLNFIIGAELNFPIYLSANGRSNILSDHRRFETEESDGIKGWGLELPAMIGFERKGFYLVGLVGYGWQFMRETYTNQVTINNQNRGAHPVIETQYDGLIYGAGIGYKATNILNIGFRYTYGNMTNRFKSTKFDDSAVLNGLDTTNNSITAARGRDLYSIDYHKFMLFAAIVF